MSCHIASTPSRKPPYSKFITWRLLYRPESIWLGGLSAE